MHELAVDRTSYHHRFKPLAPTVFWNDARQEPVQPVGVGTRGGDSKPVLSTASSLSHTPDWLKGHLITKHLGHTLLALRVLAHIKTLKASKLCSKYYLLCKSVYIGQYTVLLL